MGVDTTLIEIVPVSPLFEMMRADGEWADFAFWLPRSGKAMRNAFRRTNAETLEHLEPVFQAIEDMYTVEPRLLESAEELHDGAHRFREPLEIVAKNDRERGMVEAIFYGEKDLAPSAGPRMGVPVRWVDSARCVDIASWLGTISEETIAKAAFEAYLRRHDVKKEWSEIDIKEGKIQFDMLGKLRGLFATAGQNDNVIVVCID